MHLTSSVGNRSAWPLRRRLAALAATVLTGLLACGALLIALGGSAHIAHAAGPLLYPGSAPCDTTLQACIDGASAGDTIQVQAGTYTTDTLILSQPVSLTGVSSATVILQAMPGQRLFTISDPAVDSSVIISGLTLAGGHAVGADCTTGCGGAILITDTAQPLLANLTITNNTADMSGGGLYADSGSAVVLAGVTLYSNTSQNDGGGVMALGDMTLAAVSFQNNQCTSIANFGCRGGALTTFGSLTASASQFLSNTSHAAGGAAYVVGGGTISGSLFQNNKCTDNDCAGGGLYAGNVLTMTNTQFFSNTSIVYGGGAAVTFGLLVGNRFENNHSLGSGGGLIALQSTTISATQFVSNIVDGINGSGGGLFAVDSLTVTNSAFSANHAKNGAGLYLTSNSGQFLGDGQFVNDLFAANEASSGFGAALDLDTTGHVVIINSTIASPTLGGGSAIYLSSGHVSLTNTLIASYTVGIQNTGGSAAEDYSLFFGNSANSSGSVTSGGHSLTGNPRFVNPAANDYHLSAASLAVDAGTNAGISTDFEGDPRPQGSGFDIGFDESPFAAQADVGVTKIASAATRQLGQPLTYTLVFSNAGPNIAAGVRLTDLVPANLTAITYTSSGASLTPVGANPYVWQVASLAPGASGVITLTGVLSSGLHGNVFTNTAAISTIYSDTNAANNASAASVTVANTPPVAASDAYSLAANSTLTLTAPGVLLNDSDADHDVLSAALMAGPLTGTLSLLPDGSFTYTPPPAFAGLVTFSYRANDGLADSNTAVVTITVTAIIYKLNLPLVLR